MKIKQLIYPLLSAFLLSIAWSEIPLGTSFFFIGFVPLFLLLENYEQIGIKKGSAVFFAFLSLLTWNLIGLSWMVKLGGSSMVLVGLIYSCSFIPVLYLYASIVKKRPIVAALLFTLGWFCVEFIHAHGKIGIPVQALGYGLAKYPDWIQWYEFVGVFGGTFWVLIVNLLLVSLIRKYSKIQVWHKPSIVAICLSISIPLMLSLTLKKGVVNTDRSIKVMAVHTNLDCYNMKYTTSQDSILDYYFNLIQRDLEEEIDLVILPENAVPTLHWLRNFHNGQNTVIQQLSAFKQAHPIKNFLVGGVAYDQYTGDPKKNLLAKYDARTQSHILMHNTILNLFENSLDYRTKERLVPFEETDPYPKFSWFFKHLYASLGGFVFSTQVGNKNILSINNSIKIAPLICFESVFGNLTRRMVNEGSELLVVILNEGWYDSIYGSKRFERFSKVRAIENRRYVVRSSNRGVSSIIDWNGESKMEKLKAEEGTLIMDIPLLTSSTFYMKTGHLLNRILFFSFFPLLIYSLIRKK